MFKDKEFELNRDVEVTLIPAGQKYTIPAGTKGVITQALGGNYTIATTYGLSQVAEKDLDALGLEKPQAQTKEKSEPLTASAASVVARNLPCATTFRIKSFNPISATGLAPELTRATFAWLTSTPITSWPSLAKHAAEIEPTYPKPKILIFIYSGRPQRVSSQSA